MRCDGHYLHTLPIASLTQLSQIIPSLLGRLPDLPALGNESSTRSDENRQRLIDGIVAFLMALTHARPLILFLDNLHWADADTLTMLSRLIQRLDAHPLYLLPAYRSDELSENEPLITLLHTVRRRSPDAFMPVARLDQAGMQHLVRQVLGCQNQRTVALATVLYQATGGSAFLALKGGRPDEAERRLHRAVDFLDGRPAFRNHHNSAEIGLGLVALARGHLAAAQGHLTDALIDPVNFYPYAHVQALLG